MDPDPARVITSTKAKGPLRLHRDTRFRLDSRGGYKARVMMRLSRAHSAIQARAAGRVIVMVGEVVAAPAKVPSARPASVGTPHAHAKISYPTKAVGDVLETVSKHHAV